MFFSGKRSRLLCHVSYLLIHLLILVENYGLNTHIISMKVESANRVCYSLMLKTVKYFIDVWCFMKIISFYLSWPKITEITNQRTQFYTAFYFCFEIVLVIENSILRQVNIVLSLQKCRGDGGFPLLGQKLILTKYSIYSPTFLCTLTITLNHKTILENNV